MVTSLTIDDNLIARTAKEIIAEHGNAAISVTDQRLQVLGADEHLREGTVNRTARQIEYIEEKLRTTALVEHRLAMVQLLSDQEKTMMMIQLDLPFAAELFEVPVVSDIHPSRNRCNSSPWR